MENFKHQGDMVFVPFGGKINGKKEKHNGSFTVGYGEATGHHHDVLSDNMQVIKTEGGFVLILGSEGRVTHQEHKDIVLPIGTYIVKHEREKDWFALSVRQVVD